MRIMQILKWTVEYDAAATRHVHDEMLSGSPESCGCAGCRNFAAARNVAYPPPALDLFHQLGIEYDRESEIGSAVDLGGGRFLYSGWFHFVGRIVAGPKGITHVATVPRGNSGGIGAGEVYLIDFEPMTPGFALCLAEKKDMLPSEFGDEPVVQLEFKAEVPWVLDEPAPTSEGTPN
jgi:hypothetical protein